MDTLPLVMFLIGAVGLWGGLVLAVVNYNRKSRREKTG